MASVCEKEQSISLQGARLIAPCGMNCGLCLAFQRKKNRCQGCLGSNEHKPDYCVRCTIACCEKRQKGDQEFCFFCDSFPCRRLKQLDTRYRTKYEMSMLENLRKIREEGMDAFLKGQKAKWTCDLCGGLICVHRHKCLSCKG